MSEGKHTYNVYESKSQHAIGHIVIADYCYIENTGALIFYKTDTTGVICAWAAGDWAKVEMTR